MTFSKRNNWRDEMSEWLKRKGVVVLNPLSKPVVGFDEKLEDMERRAVLKRQGEWEKVGKEMRLIRRVDLRMVDISDFIIVNVDIDVYTVGTWEEVTLANRQKKPILLRVEQGMVNCPDWVFGMIESKYIFSTWDEVKNYLDRVDINEIDKRWCFFNFYEVKRC